MQTTVDFKGAFRSRGFTLVEIVIALVMIGLIVTIMVPPISRAMRRFTLDNAAQAFMGDLRRARIEAVKRNQGVTVRRMGTSGYTISFLGDRQLDGEAEFLAASADSVRFAAFGPTMSGPATFTIKLGEGTKTVEVNAAGMMKVR